jgi:quercetin dioxygenase-like cupin family protein
MALLHASSGDPLDVRPLGARIADVKTYALFKSAQLEVMRLVLPAGRKLPAHKVAGEITIQCIEGRLIVDLDTSARTLEAGELLFLAGGVLHGVTALADTSALVTIVLSS